MARKQRDVMSVEWVKLELLRTAYATRGGLLSRRDPRIVLGWYLVFAVVPWLTHNITTLAVLVFASQRLRMPAADGQIWRRGGS